MKIYFAGSITGGRQDQELYLEIIKLLTNYGEVLTEHIGDAIVTEKGEVLDVGLIFNRDVGWLEQSDVVVAEVTVTSLGVGYELGIAEKLGKKVICLYRPNTDKRLSAMILGNKHFSIHPYEALEDVKEILDRELK